MIELVAWIRDARSIIENDWASSVELLVRLLIEIVSTAERVCSLAHHEIDTWLSIFRRIQSQTIVDRLVLILSARICLVHCLLVWQFIKEAHSVLAIWELLWLLRCCTNWSNILLELDSIWLGRNIFLRLLLRVGSIRRNLNHILEVFDPLLENLWNILIIARVVWIIIWLFLMRHFHLELLIILRHVEPLWLWKINILNSLVLSVSCGLSSLRLAYLAILLCVCIFLSLAWSRFELLSSNFLLVHQEIRIALNLLSLTTSSSWASWRCVCILEVYCLSVLHLWSTLDFENDTVIGHILLILSSTLSATSLLVIFLLLLLL